MMIFVTGATGTTGTETVKELQKTGARLRVGTRNIEKARATLSGPNTEFVPFDYERPESYGEALRGCDRLYLTTGFTNNAHDYATALIDHAVTNGVNYIVKLSAMGVDHVPGLLVGRWHRIVERYLMSSGAAWTLLRPNAFMSNFGVFWGQTIKTENKVYLPIGNGKVSWIDPRDVGAVAAKVITTPGHAGKIYTLTGGEALDANTAVRFLSEAIGRNISFVDVPETTARDGMKKASMPDWAIQGMLELYNVWKNNYAAAPTMDVEMLLGRKPLGFQQFARDYVRLFK